MSQELHTSVHFPVLGFPYFPKILHTHNSSVIQVPKSDDATDMDQHNGKRSRRSGTSLLERGECTFEAA